MTRYRGRSVWTHEAARTARARAAFREIRGEAAGCQRETAIAALSVVEWRGRTMYTIRCTGTTGRGPHTVHVPAGLLWSLIDVRAYRCPYHA